MNLNRNIEEKIRICLASDLDAVMALQERVCHGMTEEGIFVPTSREENARFLIPPNKIFGAFFDSRLGAYCSLVYSQGAADNYGWELGWPAAKVIQCAKIDTVVVAPEFRGRGLQRKLVSQSVAAARLSDPEVILLTTVSPQNSFSLHNMQCEGFEILQEAVLYGGLKRFILGNFPGRTKLA